uniref:Uncharacterized protein n=1 Tax=Oryza glumipatula TaxID=40148 RepID=A0A0E0A0D9_9ORYZ
MTSGEVWIVRAHLSEAGGRRVERRWAGGGWSGDDSVVLTYHAWPSSEPAAICLPPPGTMRLLKENKLTALRA